MAKKMIDKLPDNISVEDLFLALKKSGVTVDALCSTIRDGLVAEKVYYNKFGEKIREPDIDKRLKSAELGFNLYRLLGRESPSVSNTKTEITYVWQNTQNKNTDTVCPPALPTREFRAPGEI